MNAHDIKRGVICVARMLLSAFSVAALIVLSALYWTEMPGGLVFIAFSLFFVAMLGRAVAGAYKLQQGSSCSSRGLRERHP